MLNTQKVYQENYLDREVLVSFVREYAFEIIGYNPETEKATTLSDEMAAIAKMVMKADVCRIAVNPYRAKLAYRLAELSEAEKMRAAMTNYKNAARKILWLNTICKGRTKKVFVTKKVSMDSMEEIEILVDEFEAAIRCASLN